MDDEPLIQLVERLQTRCLARNLTVATAESCTGGLLAKLITDVAGSSGYFRGGIVSYANEAKVRLLGVPEEQLAAHGAVSAQVARSMALGARDRTGADLAVAVTGVSGPGGGSPAKPIGLTYVAVADAIGIDVRRFVWAGDRAANREASARATVELLLERISAGVAFVADAAGEPVPYETPKAQQAAAPGEVAEAAEGGRA
jgi:PncC family amidohydrolase